MYRILYKNLPINLVFSVLILSSCAQSPAFDKDVSLESLGDKAYERQDYETAETYFKQALQSDPTISAYEGLAQTYEAQNSWNKAIEIWAAISKVDGLTIEQSDHFKLKAAKNYARLGNSLDARNYLNKIKTNSLLETREGRLVDGLTSVLEGQETKAINIFQKILMQTPSDHSIKINLALTYLVFNKPDIAITLFSEMPNNQVAKLNKSIALVLNGQDEEALKIATALQGENGANKTIRYAQDLKDMPPKSRARHLFGVK
ncbi:tetratricopeptide repeat protein [Curvivirga sp.]|uniref:tetratricopeptide repeat protein n=1 Tax=Curvivirga sp. TaxID=2856848 RepID=UPI003B5B9134